MTDFDRAKVLGEALRKTPNQAEVIQRILSMRDELLISEAHFEWLKGNDRALFWLYPQILNWHRQRTTADEYRPPNLAQAPRLELLDNIVLMLDLWPTSIAYKQEFVADRRADWGRTLEQSEVVEKWLKPDSPQQWKWAWEHVRDMVYMAAHPGSQPLTGEAPLVASTLARIALPQPVTDDDFRLSVLATMDAMASVHPSERALFISKMKQNWSQKQYLASGKAKKPLPLTESTLAKLEWMAQQAGMKTTEFAEKSISSEYIRLGGPDVVPPKKKLERKRKPKQSVGLDRR